ncbi:hypothetical protein DOTSEDRAFT_34400 [Dothistroma septosporum NZE10]|uniref:Zn(2)-C6 fungal-type domain-containing protein n=1 Tax=Dothistroma septosporum (strain NZE10 / CBS 128990) TaxID=675120 RepID=N1PN63_DOTSN|nr:hypothetical protein DOTSEDRAFT_34400 [Dothistroma septosporum NZE10]
MQTSNTKQGSRAHSPSQAVVPKLKDSCTSCATSKVRCSKDKPSCNRCKRRGMACEYDTSKRFGRTPYQSSKAAQRERQATNASHNPTDEDVSMFSMCDVTPESIPQDSQYLVDTPMLPSPMDFGTQDPLTGMDFSTSSWDGFFDSPVSTDPGYFGSNFDDFSSQSQQTAQSNTIFAPQRRYVETSHQNQTLPSTASTTASESRRSNPSHHNSSTLNNSTITRSATGLNVNQESDLVLESPPTTGAQTCCLTTTLGILLQLNPNASFGCTQPDSSYQLHFRRNVKEVVLENEQVADQVSKVLACPCSQDEYLVTLVSLIIFRLIDTYSAAAQAPSVQPDGTRAKSDGKAHGGLDFTSNLFNESTASRADDGSDNTARTVLNHLHRVQRVVNLLSNRFESMKLRDHMHRSRAGSVSPGVFGDMLGSVPRRALSISSGAFESLETDVRNRLRIVSFEIIDLIRNA